MVGNMSYDTSEQTLAGACRTSRSDHGLQGDHRSRHGRPKGFAFITFDDPNAAMQAVQTMSGQNVDGGACAWRWRKTVAAAAAAAAAAGGYGAPPGPPGPPSGGGYPPPPPPGGRRRRRRRRRAEPETTRGGSAAARRGSAAAAAAAAAAARTRRVLRLPEGGSATEARRVGTRTGDAPGGGGGGGGGGGRDSYGGGGGGGGGGFRDPEPPKVVPGGDWNCDTCGNSNFSWRKACKKCNKPKSKELKDAEQKATAGWLHDGLDDTSNRIFIKGFDPAEVKEDDLKELFGGIGIISRVRQKFGFPDEWPHAVKIYKDESGRPKDEALITYDDPMAAQSAPGFYDGYELKGKKLQVSIATASKKKDDDGGGGYGGRRRRRIRRRPGSRTGGVRRRRERQLSRRRWVPRRGRGRGWWRRKR